MFELHIRTDNAAFDDNLHEELARILRTVADQVEAGAPGGNPRDINGNSVGVFEFTERPESA